MTLQREMTAYSVTTPFTTKKNEDVKQNIRGNNQKAPGQILMGSFTLSSSELQMNACQLALFGIFAALLRYEHFSRLVTKLCSVFPTVPLHDYEPMSLMDWVTHYASLVYGLCVLKSLLGVKGASTPRRKSYGIIFSIQQFMGVITILAHTLIGTSSAAEHGLMNCANYLLLVTNFVTGFVICFPLYGWFAFAPVVYAVSQKQISFGNAPGIVLSNFALISIFFSPSNDFPSLFKLSYFLFALLPVAAKIFDPSTDINHTIVTALLTATTLLMRVSLQPIVDQNLLKAKRKSFTTPSG